MSDGWQDLRVVPAPILLSGGWTDSAAITANGFSLYFAYARIDFGQFFDSNGAIQNPSGPVRVGMTGDKFKMFRADLSNSGWNPNFLPINGDPSVHEASVRLNVAGDLIVFSRFDASGVATLYYSMFSSGTWTSPVALPTTPGLNTPNTTCTNDNGFVVGNITTLYFEPSRDDLAGTICRADGTRRLYFVTYTEVGGFSTPQLVPGLDGSLPSDDDTQISVSPDNQTVYFTRVTNAAYGVFTGDWNGSTFANVRQIVAPTLTPPFTGKLNLVGEANVASTSEGKLLYMVCGLASRKSQSGAANLCGPKAKLILLHIDRLYKKCL